LRKLPKADIRKNVQEAARILGLEDLLKRKPKELSGGQRQRVALGRAIVRKAKVFLMDEPLSNLDAQLRTQMRIEIAKLHKNLQTTFVYVTHDQTEAMTMGTRIVVMKDGLIQQIDSPQSIYDHPVNMFVAGFLGSPGMNFLEVLIIEQNGCIFAKLADALLPVPPAGGQRLKEQRYLDRKVVLGIRAEHLCGSGDFLYLSESITSLHTARRPNACEDSVFVCSISATNGFDFARLGEAGFSLDRHPECALRGRLEFSELRGAETYHYVRIAGREVVVRVSPELRAETGQEVRVDTAVKKFEELHPGVSVEVKEYTSNPSEIGEGVRAADPGDIEKYVTAMNAQLMSGQGSDIILLNNLPYQTYADKNLLVDLGGLMQSDQSFDRGKYYQNIFKALEYKDKLYGLPVNIGIDIIAADRTLLADSQVQIDDSSWDWNDFVKTAEKVINDNQNGGTREMYALAGMDEKRLIATLVKENYDSLVDPEKKTANFTGQEFLDLLSLSKYLLDHKLVNTDTAQTNITDLVSRGKLVFNFTSLGGFWDLQVAKTIFSEGVQLLKPPGNESGLFFSTGSMYGISSKSFNQELAWEFLKLLVSDDMQTQGGMPINKSVLPQIAQNFTQAIQKNGGKMRIKDDGIPAQSITLQPPTQEDVDYMENLLSKAKVYIGTDQKIISIVQEETAAFFTGQKTAETTAQLIQDRVSTYLNE